MHLTLLMNPFGMPNGATVQGRQAYALWALFFWTAAGVGVVVYALILWSIVRYRRRRDALPPQVRNNVPIEIIYTAIPLMIVIALFLLTLRTERVMDDVPKPGPPLVIAVIGFDWSWQFRYEGTDVRLTGTPERPAQLVVPVGERFRVVLTSADVIHGFWVPAFLFKRDAFPGVTNRFDLTVPASGTFVGECSRFCGLDHAIMRFTIQALPARAFRSWLRTQEAIAR